MAKTQAEVLAILIACGLANAESLPRVPASNVVGMSADFWLGLQQDWDLWHAMHSDQAAKIERLKPLGRNG